MSLQDLTTVLQQQADQPGSAISVSAATIKSASLAPNADFDTTIQQNLVLTGPLSVVVSGSIPNPQGNTLTVPGTAAFLGLTGLAVTVTFTLESDNTLDATIDAVLPANWQFSSSFPLLVGFPFADLTLAQSHFVLITAAQGSYSYSSETVTLTTGLNLVSTLAMSGALGLLEAFISTLVPADTIVFSGTVNPTGITDIATGIPVLALAGAIGKPITANTNYQLSAPQVLITTSQDSNKNNVYWLTFSTTLSVNNTPFSTFQAAILQGSTVVTFSLLPTKNAITPAEIIKLIGNTDFTTYIPQPLQSAFSAVGLQDLAVSIDTKSMTLQALSGGIGATSSWQMGQFTVDSLVLSCQVMAPFSPLQTVLVCFTATAQIYPNIFNGEFDFEISYDLTSKALTISANFQGTVSINQLVSGLSNGAITIPASLAAIQFNDFGMSFTESGGTYNYTLYGSADATFGVLVAGKPLQASFQINVDSAAQSYQLLGGLTIGDYNFEASATLSGGKQILEGSWAVVGDNYLGINQILTELGFPDPGIPSDLDLALEAAAITYDLTDNIFLITAQSKNYGACSFAVVSVSGSYQYYFLLGIDQTFSLSNLPLVGAKLAQIENIEVSQIEVVLCSVIPTTQVIADVNNLIGIVNAQGGTQYPLFPTTPLSGIFILQAQLAFGSQTIPLNLQLGGSSSSSGQKALAAPGSAALTTPNVRSAVAVSSGAGNVTWFNVQKTFGPVSFQRIGAMYQSDQQVLWFELDASLALGPVTMDLVGLGLGSPLSSFEPQFSLMGLGISYSSPPLTIAGSLTNLAPPGADYIEFEGGVSIGTGEFTVTAFGYYGQQTDPVTKNKYNSMFIFGDIAYDFGGPPAFFVTGIALGFGYNSNLRIPTIDEIATFPFVQVLPTSMVPNTGLFGANPTPQKVLDVIMNTTPAWVSPLQGTLWFAAGITFTSFELVNSQALIMVEFGQELIIALVGTSRAQFPQGLGSGVPVYAYIELDLLVEFAPQQGVFSVQAVLAKSSFLLDKACVLQGGFAFFVWYGPNPHAGDFVLTLGGYNPGYVVPSYYPKVPQVGFHWSLDSSISISGGAYFAFTPSALMVGGALNATYQSGNLKAWFDAHADIIVQWNPFWFDASFGISIGASYKVDLWFTSFTVTAELGCNLEVWGPPTGGTVGVDWYIISFSIPFGASKNSSKPVINQWSQVQAMLPNSGTAAAPNVITLSPAAGLTPTTTSPANAGNGNSATAAADPTTPAPWIVRGSQFSFNTSSSIPASSASVGGTHAITGSQFNVAPLGWSGVTATHKITIVDSTNPNSDYSSAFSVNPSFGNVPSQLWGTQSGSTPDSAAQLVPNQLVGLSVSVNPPEIGGSAGAVNVAVNLANINLHITGAVIGVSASAPLAGDVAVNSQTTLQAIVDPNSGIASTATTAARTAIFNALGALHYVSLDTKNDPLTNFASQAGGSFTAVPLLVA